jgi:hypothetical protein
VTLGRINALRDLNHAQLANLAAERNLIGFEEKGWYSADRLRLKLIDAVCDEEVQQRKDAIERAHQDGIDLAKSQERR